MQTGFEARLQVRSVSKSCAVSLVHFLWTVVFLKLLVVQLIIFYDL